MSLCDAMSAFKRRSCGCATRGVVCPKQASAQETDLRTPSPVPSPTPFTLESGQVVKSIFKSTDELQKALELTEEQKAARQARKLQPWSLGPQASFQDASTGAWSQSAASAHDQQKNYQLRLYIGEDLSRDVIEALGEKFDIEPAFFREQIVDYT